MSQDKQQIVILKILIPFWKRNNRVPDLAMIESGYMFHTLAFSEAAARLLELELTAAGHQPDFLRHTSTLLEHYFIIQIASPSGACRILEAALARSSLDKWTSFFLWDEGELYFRCVKSGIVANSPILDFDKLSADCEAFQAAIDLGHGILANVASGEYKNPFSEKDAP